MKSANGWLRTATGLAALVALAWAANVVARRIFLALVNRFASRTVATWDDRIIERRVFHRLANIAPALVTYVGIAGALAISPESLADAVSTDVPTTGWGGLAITGALLVRRVSLAWVMISLALAGGGLLNALNDIYTES